MKGFSEKVLLQLDMPSEDTSISDQKKIQYALSERGYDHVSFPLHILRDLYPKCRNADFKITVTLVYRDTDWVVTAVEPGDQTHNHYGLAVEYIAAPHVCLIIEVGTVR